VRARRVAAGGEGAQVPRPLLLDDRSGEEEGRKAPPQAELKTVAGWLCTLGVYLATGASAAEIELMSLKVLMSCLSAPSPTPILDELVAVGALTDRTGPGWDDEYCWKLSAPLDWNGLGFEEVCVVTDDPNEIGAHPELYWADSTAPWTEVWIIAVASRATLKAWATTTLPVDSKFEIDPPVGEGPESALSCSEWHFPAEG